MLVFELAEPAIVESATTRLRTGDEGRRLGRADGDEGGATGFSEKGDISPRIDAHTVDAAQAVSRIEATAGWRGPNFFSRIASVRR